MKIHQIRLFSVIVLLFMTSMVFALEVDREVMPQVHVGGRVINTLDFNSENEAAFNFNDSALLIGFDKQTYSKHNMSATIAISEGENGVQMPVLLSSIWNSWYQLSIGKSRLLNTLIEFPLQRDDDLLQFTHALNQSSNHEADQLYGKLAKLDLFANRGLHQFSTWVATRGESEDVGSARGELDTLGFAYNYEQAEGRRYVKRIRQFGFLYDLQNTVTGDTVGWYSNMIAGFDINLNQNPSANLSWSAQFVANEGIAPNVTLVDLASEARASSTALVTALRYTHRPNLLTRWQAAVTVAYKSYSDENDTRLISAIPTFFHRIGERLDILYQIRYDRTNSKISNQRTITAQVGMSFNFNMLFNDSVPERNTILQLEHRYMR
ncbi:MAG: hypothetical protein OEZ58_06080 [Gammaproteobacteria bacterium]|nr:hypothetical protein [Gammaproteobacteria bacterium]